jgi:hypothetical protein
MLACQGRRDLRSNDLFGRANQRAVGLIGRVRTSNSPFGRANQRAVGLIGRGAPRNSPFGRAQRDRTINTLDRFIFRFMFNDTIF